MVHATIPTTIIVVNDHAHISGGQPKIAITTAKGLAARGFKVIYFSTTGPIDDGLQQSDVDVICLDQPSFTAAENRLRSGVQSIWNTKAAAALSDLLDAQDPNRTIVHIHGCDKDLSPSVGRVITRSKVPHLFTMHGYFLACPNGGFFDYQTKQRCSRKPLGIDCLTTNCDSRSYAHKVWRVARQTMMHRLAHLPADLKHLAYLSDTQLKVISPYLPQSAQLHYLPNMVDQYEGVRLECEHSDRFVFVGRISVEKGAVEFAAAARQAGVKAVFVGDGPEFDAVKAANPDAEMAGWQNPETVADYLSRARALVVPSLWYETFGLVAYEALGMGLPVIIGGWNAGAEAVDHMETGIIYDKEDELAAALAQAKDDHLIKRLSENGFNRHAGAQAGSSLDQHLDQLTDLYGTIMTGASD